MKPLHTVFVVLTAAILWAALTLAAPMRHQQSGTYTAPPYTVPPGVTIRVEDDFTNTDSEVICNNWPNTPTVLPCYIEIHAVATDNLGAQSWALQKWIYTAAPTPTPQPSPTPCLRRLPNGKCKK